MIAAVPALTYCNLFSNDNFGFNFEIHYALKANSNPQILQLIQKASLGADCVSEQEIEAAIDNGFAPGKIVFAGVSKSDKEIVTALKHKIACFNCESTQEIEVINQLAKNLNTTANIALRINPNVNAKTHHYVTTGLEENKFGISEWELPEVTQKLKSLTNVLLLGIHFHIGSQITNLSVFGDLCNRVNYFQDYFRKHGIGLKHINVGGGLGVDYYNPDTQALTNFGAYFEIFNRFLDREPHQKIHFEIGRAIVAQCGSLISRVLFTKKGIKTNFVILDAGITELIRPALYNRITKLKTSPN